MKKLLPKLHNSRGFTLIELLIVVAIIAILAAITIAVYSSNNPQQKARDARRVSDVNALADGLESAYRTNGATAYPALATTMVSNGVIPQDSNNPYGSGGTAGNYQYAAASATQQVASSTLTWSSTALPSTSVSGVTFAQLAAGNPAAGSFWIICAHLEVAQNGQSWYCRSSAQQ